MNAHPQTLDCDGIAARIPHSGSMCLLDGLLGWTTDGVRCRASSHRDAAHPLRSPGGLLSPVAIEYASQAMALHGGLMATPGSRPSADFLAAARGVNLHVNRLDDVPGLLLVTARRLASADTTAVYHFHLHAESGRLLVDGRATGAGGGAGSGGGPGGRAAQAHLHRLARLRPTPHRDRLLTLQHHVVTKHAGQPGAGQGRQGQQGDQQG